MSKGLFLTGLVITAFAMLFVLFLLYSLAPNLASWGFSMTVIGLFVILTYLMYVIGTQASRDRNPYKFSRTFIVFSMGKVFMSILIIAIYYKLISGGGKEFLISFLPIYIGFTVYETMVFMKLSKPGEE
jgi:hypothetical protein